MWWIFLWCFVISDVLPTFKFKDPRGFRADFVTVVLLGCKNTRWMETRWMERRVAS